MEQGNALQITNSDNNSVLKLNDVNNLDLSSLPAEHQIELKRKHAEGMLDFQVKANDIKINVQALDATLNSLNMHTEKATQAQSSITLQHSQTTSIGRTEIIIGNTERAADGKLSRSATGEQSRTILIIAIIAIAVVLSDMFLGKG